MSLALWAAAGLVLLLPLAPVLRMEPFAAILLILGSTRWTELPPRSSGLLILALAGLLFAFACALPGASSPVSRAHPRVALYLILYTTWITLSLTWTPSISFAYGSEKIARLVLFALLPAGVLVYAIRREVFSIRRFLIIFACLCQAVGLLGFAVLMLQLALGLGDSNRLSLFGTDPITLGLLAAIGLFSTYERKATFWRSESAISLAGCWVVRIACGFAIVASASKSVLLGAILTGVLALFLNSSETGRVSEERRLRVTIFRPVHLLFALALVLLAVATLPAAFVLRLRPSSYLPGGGPAALESGSFVQRQELVAEAIVHFQQAPVIGQGIGSFNTTRLKVFGRPVRGPDGVAYPHNVFAETAAEVGLVGLLLLVVALLVVVRRLLAAQSKSLTLLCAVCVGGTVALTSGDISDHRVYIICATVAMCLKSRDLEETRPSTAAYTQTNGALLQ